MEKLIDISSYPVANVLDLLLQDKSTKKNIIWATDTYEEFGEGFTDKVQMDANALLRRTDIIRPRIQKSLEAQAQRTRKKAEVFTPAWLCNRMNNHCDEDWFGRAGVFNTENEDHTWTVTEGRIEFPKRKKWQHYVDSRRLEITCGEAPYLVSRYDVSTGELIVPPIRRIGMLDRKLRIVNENTDTYEEWLKWTIRAFEASYGYEYQGDNVLIARINLLLTFMDYYEERWERRPDDKLLEQVANKIVWNIWQMDGLKDTVPLGKPYEEFKQMTLFDMLGVEDESEDVPEAVPCRIFNWRSNASLKFMDTMALMMALIFHLRSSCSRMIEREKLGELHGLSPIEMSLLGMRITSLSGRWWYRAPMQVDKNVIINLKLLITTLLSEGRDLLSDHLVPSKRPRTSLIM